MKELQLRSLREEFGDLRTCWHGGLSARASYGERGGGVRESGGGGEVVAFGETDREGAGEAISGGGRIYRGDVMCRDG